MRVLVVDDQRVVREGLVTIVGTLAGMEVVGEAADGAEAVRRVEELAPDVVLMDLRMPGLDGVGATAAIRRDHPGTQIVVLTTFADDESIIAALTAGATGYLTKDASRDDIRRAIEAAAAGQSVLDPAVQARLLQAARQAPAAIPGPVPAGPAPPSAPPAVVWPDGLTDREGEVLVLVAQGLNNQEIAARLYVSEATVKTHINHIFAKTRSRDRTAAAAYAHRRGLVS